MEVVHAVRPATDPEVFPSFDAPTIGLGLGLDEGELLHVRVPNVCDPSVVRIEGLVELEEDRPVVVSW